MKILFTSVFFLLTTLCYSQQSRLFQNVNFRAKELKHRLNEAGDSLTLEGERTIYKVEIFNKNFEQSIIVDDSKVIIPLSDLPLGRFVVQASLKDKLIVLTLLRDQSINGQIASDTPPRKTSLFGATPLTPRPEPMGAEDQIEAPRLVVVQKTDLIVSHTANIASANNANANTTKHASIATNAAASAITETDVENFKVTEQTLNVNPAHRKVKAYWIEYKTNANYGGGTVKRIGDQAIVERMIAIITLDKKTIAGRHNELTIWEVFDVSQFLKYKRKQKNDLSDEAECFNAKPYFKA